MADPAPEKDMSKTMKTKRIDPDISALKACVKALDHSTSRQMLRANMAFLNDRYIVHPSPELPEHLRPVVTVVK